MRFCLLIEAREIILENYHEKSIYYYYNVYNKIFRHNFPQDCYNSIHNQLIIIRKYYNVK